MVICEVRKKKKKKRRGERERKKGGKKKKDGRHNKHLAPLIIDNFYKY